VSSLENYVRREYGDIADIFTTYRYPVYERPKYNERDLKPTRDPFGIRREEIKRLSIIRLEKIEKIESNKPKVYALIKGQLSLESLEKVKSLPGWNDVEQNCDPIELCKRIMATHLVQAKADIEETKFEARQQFSNCKQQWNESTSEFKKRYEFRIRALQSVGEHTLDDAAMARDFLGKLDLNRYEELMKDYRNGLHPRATNLEDAYQLANNYITPRKHYSGRPVFMTAGRVSSRRPYGARGNGRNYRKMNGRGRGNGRGYHSQAVKKPSREEPCSICGKPDHWRRDCPEKNEEAYSNEEEKEEHIQPAPPATNNRRRVNGRVNVVLTTDTVDNDDYDINEVIDEHLPVTTLPANEEVRSNLKDIGVNVLAAIDKLHSSDIVLDTGGSTSIFYSKSCLTNIYESDTEITISGISDEAQPIQTSLVGKSVFGTVYYSPRCIANVISYSELKDNAIRVWQESEDDIFRVQMVNDGPIYLFKRKCGVYVHNTNDHKSIIENKKLLTVTVSENERKYTKREVERAKHARDLYDKLGYPSTAALVKMVSSGGILNCDITAKDIMRAVDIYGPPLANLKGKTTSHKAPTINMDVQVDYVKKEQISNIDIMFINEIPFLVNVLTPLNYTFVDQLKSRNAGVIFKILWKQLSHCMKNEFTVKTVRCDPEAGLVALDQKLAESGISLDVAGQEEAVPVVESKIRRLKERARGIINTLPFKIPRRLLI